MGENSKSVAPRFEECERKACGERQRLSLDRGKPGCTVPLTLFRPKCGRFRFRAQRQRTPTRSRRTRVGAKSYNRPRISYGVANSLAHSVFSVPFRSFRSKTESETISPLKTSKNQVFSGRFASCCVLLRKSRKGAERTECASLTVRRMRPIIRLFRHSPPSAFL